MRIKEYIGTGIAGAALIATTAFGQADYNTSARMDGNMPVVGISVTVPFEYMTEDAKPVIDTDADLERSTYFPSTAWGTTKRIFAGKGKQQALKDGKPLPDTYTKKVNIGDNIGAIPSAAWKWTVGSVFKGLGWGIGKIHQPTGNFVRNINDKCLEKVVDTVCAVPGHVQDLIFVPNEGADSKFYNHIPIVGYITPRDITNKDVYEVDGVKDIDVVSRYSSDTAWKNGLVVLKTVGVAGGLASMGGSSGSEENNNQTSNYNYGSGGYGGGSSSSSSGSSGNNGGSNPAPTMNPAVPQNFDDNASTTTDAGENNTSDPNASTGGSSGTGGSF